VGVIFTQSKEQVNGMRGRQGNMRKRKEGGEEIAMLKGRREMRKVVSGTCTEKEGLGPRPIPHLTGKKPQTTASAF
jgi:hypothetical protein